MPTPAPLRRVDALLAREHPDARTALEHRTPFELLVATVLSAQTTDVRVNAVTPGLFAAWPDARALAAADPAEVLEHVRPLGMGETRARRIRGLAAGLVSRHDGRVPDDQAALEALPGIGRKTAHVLRGVAFGHDLLAVDTHVGRLSRRLGWTAASDPRRVEEDVARRAQDQRVPVRELGLRLILHGRTVCTARAPRCAACVLAPDCPRVGVAA